MTGKSISAPQTATADLHGKRIGARLDVAVTPLGLLAIGTLVAAILVSVVPIIRAAGDIRR